MSVGICVVARKQILSEERDLLVAYRVLAANDMTIPEKLQQSIAGIIGRAPGYSEELNLNYDKLLEVPVRSKGDVMYGEGKVIKLANLPPGTVELRIYAQA